MNEIVEKIKGSSKALLAGKSDAYVIERVQQDGEDYYSVTYCWFDYTGWESEEIQKIKIGEEKRLALLMLHLAMPEEWLL